MLISWSALYGLNNWFEILFQGSEVLKWVLLPSGTSSIFTVCRIEEQNWTVMKKLVWLKFSQSSLNYVI